jgi:hypothetical protein
LFTVEILRYYYESLAPPADRVRIIVWDEQGHRLPPLAVCDVTSTLPPVSAGDRVMVILQRRIGIPSPWTCGHYELVESIEGVLDLEQFHRDLQHDPEDTVDQKLLQLDQCHISSPDTYE